MVAAAMERVTACAAYDCLPGIGHACGHNIIAAMAVGASIAAAQEDRPLHVQCREIIRTLPPLDNL